jgi:hypothetical protein
LTEKALQEHHITMTRPTYVAILAGLHPDASEEIRARGRTLLEGYEKKVLRTDEGKINLSFD